MNKNEDDTDYFECELAILAAVILVFALYTATNPKPSKGYGGSPGHMSPMEVEALYEKNRP